MAINDVYQVTLEYNFRTAICNNVFFYQLTSGTDPNHAFSMYSAFSVQIVPLFLACMSSDCFYDAIEVVNLMDTADFYTLGGLVIPGDLSITASAADATFTAFSYRFERAYPGAPSGYKRFPGVAESYTSENLYIPPGGAAQLLADGMAVPISDVILTDTFAPVIVKRPFSFAVPPTVWYPITVCTYTNLTTQSSRKL